MAPLLVQKLASLQGNVENIRNICILAHVDHGKTSLADSLVATNGVISSRLAGKLRYMDSRTDEQERGITMKSSAIALFYLDSGREYLINLMDSPGHVDFSSEVSTAVRLCDGAILVVDVVEGVQPQTKVVLKQAWEEGIKPVLVLNKLDRLVVEMKHDTLAAYHHMAQVLEQVNALVAELFTQGVMASKEIEQKNSSVTEKPVELGVNDVYDWSSGLEEADDSNIYFSPEQGNVVFASAIDGWAFSLQTFAEIYSRKLGFSEKVLNKTLWGDFFINMKAKKICSGASVKAKKPLFVSLVLDNIWAVYDAAVIRKDKEKLEKIVSSLQLKVAPRDLRTTDGRQQLNAVFSAWLPLASAVLRMVANNLPAPKDISSERAEKLICSRNKKFSSLPPATQELRDHFVSCSSSGPTIVFVSKMFPTPRSQLPENRARPLSAEEMTQRRAEARARHLEKQESEAGAVQLTEQQLEQLTVRNKAEEEEEKKEDELDLAFIAFARVYSGKLEPGQEVWVLGPKYNPAVTAEGLAQGNLPPPNSHVTKVTVGSLYILLGRELEEVTSVPAGNVVGIAGLASSVLKSATLSSSPWCPPFVPQVQSSVPILRVAVEPTLSSDLPKLEAGLQLLNQADAHVEVIVSESGEHLLVTAGEVHLQRCLADLQDSYACCEVTASDPIVPFRETIVKPPDIDRVNEAIEKGEKDSETGEIVIETPNKQCKITLKAVPLSGALAQLLEAHSDLIRDMDRQGSQLPQNTLDQVKTFRTSLVGLMDQDKSLAELGDRIMSFGPKRCGPNMLIDSTGNGQGSNVWPGQETSSKTSGSGAGETLAEFENSLLHGFQLATLAGPLCEEQMMGVGFVVVGWEMLPGGEEGWGPVSGQIVSTVKEGCRRAFLAQPPRLMTAMYSCNIAVKAEVLGKMFNVLNRRRGQVVQEELIEGSSTFTVTAHIPVIESMDFGAELRKQTSGMAMPQLVFSHWEVVDIDPNWEPNTEEELLHFGEKADSENPARRYMNNIRKRKGLKIDEKIVEFAEKQRTLTKSK